METFHSENSVTQMLAMPYRHAKHNQLQARPHSHESYAHSCVRSWTTLHVTIQFELYSIKNLGLVTVFSRSAIQNLIETQYIYKIVDNVLANLEVRDIHIIKKKKKMLTRLKCWLRYNTCKHKPVGIHPDHVENVVTCAHTITNASSPFHAVLRGCIPP